MIDGLDRVLTVWEEENSIVTHFQMLTYILISRFSMTAWQRCGYLSFRASCHQLSRVCNEMGKWWIVDLVAEIICIGEAVIKNYAKQLLLSNDFCSVLCYTSVAMELWDWM